MDSYARFRATLIDSQIDTLEILAGGGTLLPEFAEERAAEIAAGAELSEQQKARLAHIVTTTKARAGFSAS